MAQAPDHGVLRQVGLLPLHARGNLPSRLCCLHCLLDCLKIALARNERQLGALQVASAFRAEEAY